jgi:hypothetical protein
MNDDRTIFDLRDDPMLREELLDTLESMLKSHSSDFRDTISYVLDNKLDLFKEFDGPFYEGEDNMLDLILPAITRLYGKYFITPPTILKSDRLDLYQLSFDIDHFIDYFIDIIPKVKNSLEHLENLDRTAETLSLVVDNYIASRFKYAYECIDILQEIREVKLKKIVK